MSIARSAAITRLKLESTAKHQMLDITDAVRKHLRLEGMNDGLVVLMTPHALTGLCVGKTGLPLPGDGVGDTAQRAALVGSSVQLIVDDTKLLLGPDQSIYLSEFDGPRPREIAVYSVDHGVHGRD